MAVQIATRIIDGDGHLNEDVEAIVAHLPSPYREIAKHGADCSRRSITFTRAGWSRPRPSATGGR